MSYPTFNSSTLLNSNKVQMCCACGNARPALSERRPIRQRTNGFDFDTAADGKRAWDIVHRDEPLLLIGSPPCTYFTNLNELNKHLNRDNPVWIRRFDEHIAKAKRHVRFCAELYKHQTHCNRYFLHEHPWLARSWQLDCMKEVENLPSTVRVRLDMCKYCIVSHCGPKNGPLGPVLKPTGMLTNSWCLQRELSSRCPGNHEHVHLAGGRASAAQEYPRQLCEAICRGLAKQRREDLSNRFTILPMCDKRLFVVLRGHWCCERR